MKASDGKNRKSRKASVRKNDYDGQRLMVMDYQKLTRMEKDGQGHSSMVKVKLTSFVLEAVPISES